MPVKFVMDKIMSIDRDAEAYRKGIEELLKEKQLQLEKTIDDLKLDWQEEAKAIKSEVLNKKLEEAEERAKNIREEKNYQLDNIKAKYESNRSLICEEIFNKIIESL
jgi:ElaB/YqjD/DUF883 family membrane-anchored ribosome-binding protein